MYGYGGGYGGLGGDYGAGLGGGPLIAGPAVASGGGGFTGRIFRMFGWLLTILSIASLAVAVANTTYTYINYQTSWEDGSCPLSTVVINMCLVPFVYISSGIWGSVVVFITGIISLRISVASGLLRIFQTLVLVSLVVFTPAMMVINAIEIAAGNIIPQYYTISESGVEGDVAKFILPLVVAALAALEFLILLLMLCYIFTNRASSAGEVVMGEPIDGGFGGFGGDLVYGDDLGYGGEEMFDSPYYPGDVGGGGGYIAGGGGSGGGGGGSGGGGSGGGAAAGGASSSAAGGGASGGGGASNNNNNNNIVVPPVIFPPAPAAAPQMMPFPIYIPQGGGGNPVVVTTTSNPPGPVQYMPQAPAPPPQPIFLPLPPAPRRRPLPPPPRPVLRPLPPTRYYPQRRVGEVRRYAGASYMSGLESPFSGKPWDRY